MQETTFTSTTFVLAGTAQTTFEEQGIRFEEWIKRILEIAERQQMAAPDRLGAAPPKVTSVLNLSGNVDLFI